MTRKVYVIGVGMTKVFILVNYYINNNYKIKIILKNLKDFFRLTIWSKLLNKKNETCFFFSKLAVSLSRVQSINQ